MKELNLLPTRVATFAKFKKKKKKIYIYIYIYIYISQPGTKRLYLQSFIKSHCILYSFVCVLGGGGGGEESEHSHILNHKIYVIF